MRIMLGVEYNGHSFYGWQRQAGLVTVQGKLEEALSHIAATPIHIFCAGRTDAGVHATGQVVHFDTDATRPLHAWIIGTNTYLPSTISVRAAAIVDEHFHARHSALARRYRYQIYQQPFRSALLAHRATWIPYALDISRMQAAATYLLGEHDFSSFRASQCDAKTPIRHIREITISQSDNMISIEIEANAFLHHMVRNIVGVLLHIGRGYQDPAWMQFVLAQRNRRAGAATAPADGLYLIQVVYPDSIGKRGQKGHF